MGSGTVKRGCPFYKDEKGCKKLQSERNCYQCPLVELEILKVDFKKEKDISSLNAYNFKLLQKENEYLKYLLGDKILKEHQDSIGEIQEVKDNG